MDQYDLDKKVVKLEEILSELGGIYEDMSLLRSRFEDVICELEDMMSDLEAFGD